MIQLTQTLMGTFARMAVLALLFAPSVVFAADGLEGVLLVFGRLISIATPIIVGFALLVFFWGLAVYVMNFSAEEKDKKKGRDIMTYGLLTLFVIVSVWGLVQILQETFGISAGNEGNEQASRIPYIIPPPSN